jgi:diguanylate cyclase (GGDEF)-like protein
MLKNIHRGWWIIALSTLVALNVALISNYRATPMYRAETQLIVTPNREVIGNDRDVVNSLDTLDKRSVINTWAEMINSRILFEEAAGAINLDSIDLDEYDRLTVVLPDANILQISVEGPDPQITAQLANAMAQLAIDFLKERFAVFSVEFLDQAIVPEAPFSPNIVQSVSLAVVFGLVLGIGLTLLRTYLLIPLEAIQKMRATDNVTRVYNRRYIERQIEKELAQNKESALSLGLIQLNSLQDMIDTLPQSVLQPLLRNVTRTLQHELRGSDIVGRWDDTTFAILLPSTPITPAKRTLERVQKSLSLPVELENNDSIFLDPHIGGTSRQADEVEPVSVLISVAEAALELSNQEDSKIIVFPAASKSGREDGQQP